MGKLHEILAVEGDLSGTAKKVIEEATHTFAKKPDLFIEETQITSYFAEEDAKLNTTVTSAMTTTVDDKLAYLAGPVARYYNAYLAKEATNQTASADIVIDDVVVFKAVPAVVLLGMETKLKELRAVYESIPTLAPGIVWEPDTSRPGSVQRSRDPEIRFINKRTITPVELSPATKEHPAQVKAIEVDVPVAKREVIRLSGMLSSADKSKLLARLDQLIRSVKKARQRANSVEALSGKGFGEALLAFIASGELPSAK